MSSDTYVGYLGEITSFPRSLRGLTSIWAPGDPQLDYGALYALPDHGREQRQALDAAGYWSHR